jgi:hypothetical protein
MLPSAGRHSITPELAHRCKSLSQPLISHFPQGESLGTWNSLLAARKGAISQAEGRLSPVANRAPKENPPHGPRSILALWHAPRDKFRAQGSVRCESSAKVGVRRTCLSLRCPEVGEDSEVRATLDEVLPRAGFLGLSSSPRLRAARSFPGPVSSPTQVPRFQCCELYSRKVASFSSLRSPFHSPPAGKDLRQVPPRLVEQTPRVGAF